MKSKNIFWAIFFIILIIICCIWFGFASKHSGHKQAEIYLNGECIRVIDNIDIDKVESVTIESSKGHNKVCWQNGEIWVEEADCENQTCVNFGRLSVRGLTIICAPHGMEIRIVDKQAGADIIH